MNVTVTLQQLRKIRNLSSEDMERLELLIRQRGVIEAKDRDKDCYSGLRAKSLVASKAGKIWVKFDVCGVRPRPFVGNATVNREGKLAKNDVKTFASIFGKQYRKIAGEIYGDFEGIEWAFLNRLIKEYTTDEFRVLMQLYMKNTKLKHITIKDFYATRQKWFREMTSMGGLRKEADSEEASAGDDGW